MASANSYNVEGNREDLTDVLTIVEPEKTPILSTAAKTRATATFHEYQVDNLSRPSFGGVNEGEDVQSFANKAANRKRLGNYIQKFRRAYRVSDIQEAVDTAAVPSEFAYGESKAIREMNRDIESAIASDNDRQQEDGQNPYKLRGIGNWTNNPGPADVGELYQTPTASINTTVTSSLTEDPFNAVAQSVYEQNGNVNNQMTLCAGPSLKRAISDFQRADTTGNDTTYTVTQPAGENKITLNVLQYETDFGVITITPTLFNGVEESDTALTDQSRARGYMYDPEMVNIAMLKAPGSQELENQGGGRRGFCDAMLTLVIKNPLAFAQFRATA